jgi:predicted ribonuclease YlaK
MIEYFHQQNKINRTQSEAISALRQLITDIQTRQVHTPMSMNHQKKRHKGITMNQASATDSKHDMEEDHQLDVICLQQDVSLLQETQDISIILTTNNPDYSLQCNDSDDKEKYISLSNSQNDQLEHLKRTWATITQAILHSP